MIFKVNRMRGLLLLVFLWGVAPTASAWSVLGHRLVGELAQRQLTPAANAQVAALLAGEPEPSLGGVSAWADRLRDTDAQRSKETSRWHYVNFPAGQCAYDAARDCPGGNCVVGAIQAQRVALRDRSRPLAERRDALKFLVHFVGDVHQPLHASNRKDKGGNEFQISLRTDLKPEAYAMKHYANGVMGTNLHAVWDYYILGSAGLGASTYAERLASAPLARSRIGKGLDPGAWAGESCQLIDAKRLYPKSRKMDSAYLTAQRPLAEQQVQVAAKRLADLLNDTFTE